jgi:hypothetical protein
MGRGQNRWAEKAGEVEVWRASVDLGDGSIAELSKAEYDAAGHQPPFWQLPKPLRSHSATVAEGMKGVVKDFSARVAPMGFKNTRSRLWTRVNDWSIESIYFHRDGSSYGGAPYSPSISIRVMIGIHVLNDPESGVGVMSDNVRREDGGPYHHRFNAETWSTYDECLDDLALYVSIFAEAWFSEWRAPEKLLTHPELRPATRVLLEEALAGRAIPSNVAASLKKFGIRRSHVQS